MVVWGYFLDPRYDSSDTILHEDLKDIEGFKRSGWSQRLRYLTEFGFIQGDWYNDLSGQLGFDMHLSKSGIELKNNLRAYLEEAKIPLEDLLNWPREKGLPDLVINSYVTVLAEVSPISRNITAFEKTIFCALNMCMQGDLFKQNREGRPTNEEEIELIERYFDVNSVDNTDYKWIGWIAENLVDLNLVDIYNNALSVIKNIEPKTYEDNYFIIKCSIPTIGVEYGLENELRKDSSAIDIENVDELRQTIGEAFINDIVKYVSEVSMKTDDGVISIDWLSFNFKDRIKIIETFKTGLLKNIMDYISEVRDEIDKIELVNFKIGDVQHSRRLAIDGNFFMIS
jgi:hypothetical protein